MVSSSLKSSLVAERQWLLCLGTAILMAVIIGCGRKKEAGNGKSVTGKVVYHDQPVAGCTVTFIAPFNSAFGMTDDQGRFQLRTSQGDKVPLGDYKVTVLKTETPAPGAQASESEYRPPPPDAPPPPEPKDLLPARYKQADTSQLTAQVTDTGPNDFTFTLTD